MKQAPNIIPLREIYTRCVNAHTGQGGSTMVQVGNCWVLARYLGFYGIRSRLKATWLVFTGRADALVWPEDDPQFNGIKE